jgi:hypothetical protein
MERVKKNKNDKWWQLFKTGNHVSRSGEEFNADKQKIDAIINATINHEYANNEIPICIGHKREDSPKWGAFKKDAFKRSGEYLVGRYDYLVTEFAEYINRKMFDKVSIALYPDLAIKHVAILGVQAPAIKDLGPVELNELADDNKTYMEIEFNEPGEYEKSAGWFSEAALIIREIKKILADKCEPGASLNNLNLPRLLESAAKYFLENKTIKIKEYSMPEKTTELAPQEFSEKLSEYEKEIAALKGKILESEIKEFCESPVMVRKITPGLYPHVKQVYTDLSSDSSEIEFSEGEGENKKIIKTTLLGSFRKILAALPDSVEFSEHATKEKAGVTEEPDISEFSEMTVNDDSLELHRQALKIQAADKCSYVEAVKKASLQSAVHSRQ